MKLARIAFILSSLGLVTFAAFGFGVYTANARTPLYEVLRAMKDDVVLLVNEVTSAPDAELVAVRPGTDAAVTRNLVDDDALVLISGYLDGRNEVRLIDRAGGVVASWPFHYGDFFNHPPWSGSQLIASGRMEVDLHGAMANPDGSVVFNFEYSGAVKLSACGETVWALDHATHHSVERSEKGGYWIPGRINHRDNIAAPFPPFTMPGERRGYFEDLVMRVSEDGKIIEYHSLMALIYENGLEALVTATGQKFDGVKAAWRERELGHLNKIEELPSSMAAAFPLFEAGDLALSLRKYNLILVVDPDDWRVKWSQTGPWLRQHDPEFDADGGILVLNNNAYLSYPPGTPSRGSNIMRVDPVTRDVSVLWGDGPDEAMFTRVRGKHQRTPGGGLVVTEFERGRVFEIDSAGAIVWEYVNRIDDQRVGELTEARVYPRDYFEDGVFDCAKSG